MEEWREVKGYEGLYEVSNYGNVRSLDRTRVLDRGKWGKSTHTFRGKVLSQGNSKDGYKLVVLCDGKKGVTKAVHRLVAEAFLENPRCCLEVNHIDEDKTNNKVENLEWCTHIENAKHGTRGQRIGIAHRANKSRCKKVFQYDKNGTLVGTYYGYREASEKTGFNRRSIAASLNKGQTLFGYTWKH